MTINSIGILEDKNTSRSRCSSKNSNISSCRLIKINFAGKNSRCRCKAFNKDIKSPYFANDKVQILNRATEKKLVNKKPDEVFSSFPLTASVYKANSDEFKLNKKRTKKIKKSVLTLPNKPAPMPKTYAVSDLNDSEGFNIANDSKANKPKKRRCIKRYKKARVKEHAMELYDRDARYCSQLNIDLDCSSSEVVNFTGDGKKMSGLNYKSNNSANPSEDPHDVWNVLRNINKFQFIPSSISQESVVPVRKTRPIIRKNNRNDTHFIETCHTEEFSYISSYEVDSKAYGRCSPSSSSFDRVTVIDKKNEQSEIIQQLSQNILNPNLKFKNKIKSNINYQMRGKNKLRLKNCSKKISNDRNNKENNPVSANKTHEETPQLETENMLNCVNLRLPEVTEDLELCDVLKSIEFDPCSDQSSLKEKYQVSNDQTNNLRNADGFREENKINNSKELTKSHNIKVNEMKHIGDPGKQLSSITKAMSSKGQEIVSSKFSEFQRKPRLALTLPNSNLPKISQLEIKRRIANQKFPIVVLEKDQLTNQGIYVSNDDPPQFYGLDNHVWPFMLEWSEERLSDSIKENLKKETIKPKNPKGKQKISHRDDVITRINHKDVSSNCDVILKQADECKKVKLNIATNNYSKQLVNEVSSKVTHKPKPLFLLKNKMFQFLHKKPTNYSENDWSDNQIVKSTQKHKQVCTSDITKNLYNSNNDSSPINVKAKEVRDNPIENKIVNKTYSSLRHPWANGKWASDFIENIIKKIRTGVYYGIDLNENKDSINLVSDAIEVSTQTELHASKNAYCQNGVDYDLKSNQTFKKDDYLKNIPGFDTTLPTLEIETITTNTIAVKHCISNVIVQFDVQLMSDTKNVSQSNKLMSCIPITLNDNQEKIFKCNTSIINAILPAELCSIIPSMMQTLLNAENNLISQPWYIENSRSHLIPQSSNYFEPESTQFINAIMARGAMSDIMKPIMSGRFANVFAKKDNSTNIFLSTENNDSSAILGPTINIQMLCQCNEPSMVLHLSRNNNGNTSNILIDKPEMIPINTCTALQLYEPRNHSIIPFLGSFSVANFINNIVYRVNLIESNKKFNILYSNLMFDSNIMITKPILLPRSKEQNMLCLPPRREVGIISLFNAFKKNNQFLCKEDKDVNSFNAFEPNSEKKEKPHVTSDNIKAAPRRQPKPIQVPRKKNYVRCHRNCNSMSSIPSYKSTPLSRVTNLNEFCQVLGSNAFCSVLDGCLEKKILGAVEEMKNWITDLSPKQALLILLLTNKKDTPNLIRFRPVLLQGIAFNRITKAVELDTEIEVIERENFHKVAQCEGISYLPASTKNRDRLLEELYWIAKTTASDYQKTFDESSEKLLKSLLGKRKKLNPSYLRVMARYVGLGLLSPKNS